MRRLAVLGLALSLMLLRTGAQAGTIARGAFVQQLWELCGAVPYDCSALFSDVDPDAPWAQAVAWAAGGGLVLGDGAGRFWPDAPLTCGQLELILSRADAQLERPTAPYLPGAWPEDPVASCDAAQALQQWRTGGACPIG